MKEALFTPSVLPDGSLSDFGRLPCPHCGDLHLNPEGGSDLWLVSQVKALAAMKASRVCASCGKPSWVLSA